MGACVSPCVCACVCMCASTYGYVCAYACVCTCVCVHVCVRVRVWHMCVHMHVCACVRAGPGRVLVPGAGADEEEDQGAEGAAGQDPEEPGQDGEAARQAPPERAGPAETEPGRALGPRGSPAPPPTVLITLPAPSSTLRPRDINQGPPRPQWVGLRDARCCSNIPHGSVVVLVVHSETTSWLLGGVF